MEKKNETLSEQQRPKAQQCCCVHCLHRSSPSSLPTSVLSTLSAAATSVLPVESLHLHLLQRHPPYCSQFSHCIHCVVVVSRPCLFFYRNKPAKSSSSGSLRYTGSSSSANGKSTSVSWASCVRSSISGGSNDCQDQDLASRPEVDAAAKACVGAASNVGDADAEVDVVDVVANASGAGKNAADGYTSAA
jgi:hypothetical protein